MRTSPECITDLSKQINFEGKPAAERMGRLPLRNIGNVKKVESAVSNDRKHTVRYLAETTRLEKPIVHTLIKIRIETVKGNCKMGSSFFIGG